jgi:hypothetical protein
VFIKYPVALNIKINHQYKNMSAENEKKSMKNEKQNISHS